MKSFKSYIYEPPGAGYWGTNKLRRNYVQDTPGQTDPITIKKEVLTPQVFQSKSSKPGMLKPKRQDSKK